jgi:hypothetical protein
MASKIAHRRSAPSEHRHPACAGTRAFNARFNGFSLGALRNFPFTPKVHLNYEETVLPIKDGLPKLKDFPAAIEGSDETLPE